MRVYGTEQGERLTKVICNGCSRELKVEQGYLKEGCFGADVRFGYFSKKDGLRHRFDLCETCYDKMIKRFALPVEEETEALLL